MTFMFFLSCIFVGIAAWSSRKQGGKPSQYDWDQAI